MKDGKLKTRRVLKCTQAQDTDSSEVHPSSSCSRHIRHRCVLKITFLVTIGRSYTKHVRETWKAPPINHNVQKTAVRL